MAGRDAWNPPKAKSTTLPYEESIYGTGKPFTGGPAGVLGYKGGKSAKQLRWEQLTGRRSTSSSSGGGGTRKSSGGGSFRPYAKGVAAKYAGAPKAGTTKVPDTMATYRKIRSDLTSAARPGVQAQFADIEAERERALSFGLSNLISSGLAGTTVTGGMTAGVQDVASRAKGRATGAAEQRADEMAVRLASLAQAGQLAGQQMQLQREEGAAGRAAAIDQSLLGITRPTTAPGLDAFGNPMVGSAQMAAMQPSIMQTGPSAMAYPNLSNSLLTQQAPRLF